MKNQALIGLALLLGAVGIYFGLVAPLSANVQALKPRIQQLDEALKSADMFRERMKELSSEFLVKTDNENARRLKKLLPDHVDNVRLIIDINNIARGRDVAIRDFTVSESVSQTEVRGANRRARIKEVAASGPQYRSVALSFTAEAPYSRFLEFLTDLQSSLRLVDVRQIQVSPTAPSEGEESAEGEPDYQYSLTLTTYWLE